MWQRKVISAISCLVIFTATSTQATVTVNDVINAAQNYFPAKISQINSLLKPDVEDSAVEGRQTIQIDRTGIKAAFGAEHIAGLLRAWLWQNCIFVLLEAVTFPILVYTYKEIFCAWGTGDCTNRFKMPKFEPDTDLVFVVDKKKTISLNKKNALAKDRPPFELAPGYKPLNIFPPLGDRPEPPPDFSEATTTPGASRREDEAETGNRREDRYQPDKRPTPGGDFAMLSTAAKDLLGTFARIFNTSL